MLTEEWKRKCWFINSIKKCKRSNKNSTVGLKLHHSNVKYIKFNIKIFENTESKEAI